MTTRWFGAPVQRNEDPALLTGAATFVDDVQLPGMLHVAFVRSQWGHGRIRSIDTTAAAKKPGVVRVFTATDLGDYWKPGPLLVSPPPIPNLVFTARTQVPLAFDKIRHVGEPIVAIVAESRYAAEDAAEEVIVDVEPLEAVVDLERALDPDAPRVHDNLDSKIGRASCRERE